eukprot:3939582-Rhodomonas_salina.2
MLGQQHHPPKQEGSGCYAEFGDMVVVDHGQARRNHCGHGHDPRHVGVVLVQLLIQIPESSKVRETHAHTHEKQRYPDVSCLCQEVARSSAQLQCLVHAHHDVVVVAPRGQQVVCYGTRRVRAPPHKNTQPCECDT